MPNPTFLCDFAGTRLARIRFANATMELGVVSMIRKLAALAGLLAFCAGAAQAEEDKPVWKAPFGGTFTAGATFATDYSYRGISQTQRQVAFQPTITYETPTVSESLLLSAYAGAWASNVYFPGTGAAA